MKYFIYTRKSSEAEDRQVISVESQIEELKKIAEVRQLNIVKIFREEMSAKAPGRPIFNEMMKLLAEGKAEGILSWKLNRLARNPIDGGQITWRLQENALKHIVTSDREYFPNDNVLMMSVEFGMANQFILDLRKDTKRGMDNKIKNGWYPSYAPLGYLNDPISPQGHKKIYKDEHTFNAVRKLWDFLLTGIYSVKGITEKAREMGIRTRRTNEELKESTLHNMFRNIFYTGYFKYNGKIYENGKHPPMVSHEEFEKAQIILGIRSKPKPQKHNFPFTGLIRCGECGAMITAEEKYKIQKNGNIHHFIYYHCTKRINRNCTQGSIRQEFLDAQISTFLSKIMISDRFKNWAIKHLQKMNETENQERNQVYESHQRNFISNQKQIDNLLDLRLKEVIDDETYKSKKEILLKEQKEIKKYLAQTENRAKDWLELAEKAFDFCRYACYWFDNGSIEDKKIILSTIGSNLLLKDKKLYITPVKLFSLIREPQKVCEWGG